MCKLPKCGDGFLQAGELCDDGNLGGGDGCTSQCKPDGKIVFVTSSVWLGDLGGMSGADGKCASAATAAGLDGEFKAWLSTDDQDAASRLTHSTQPYYLTNGVKVAQNWDDLLTPPLLAAINFTEKGEQAGATTTVWTATNPDGTNWPVSDCTVWSSDGNNGYYGLRDATDATWTKSGSSQQCKSKMAHLYCFQQ